MTTEIVEQTTDVVSAESTPANEIAVPAQEVVNTDSTPVDEFDADASEETEITGSEPSGAQKRIKQLAAQRKVEQEARIKAERELAYYKGLNEARGVVETPKSQENKAEQLLAQPHLDDFETYEEYERAKDEYLVHLTESRIAKKFLEQQSLAQARTVQQQYTKRIQEASLNDPTIVQIASDPTLPVSAAMGEIIQRSEFAPQILKWLNNNRIEAARIAELSKESPMLAAHEMGMVVATIKNIPKPTPPKRVSAAPDPIQTLTPTSPATVDEDDLSMEEYYRRRTKQIYGR